MMLSPGSRTCLAALALLAAGAGAGRLLADEPAVARADAREGGRASMEVVNHSKSNEPLVFIYDEESHRLLVYTTIAGSEGGVELRVAAIRNTQYDARVTEYRNRADKGMSVREIRRAVEEEEQREREAAQRRAEEEKKKAEKEKKAS